MTSKDRLLNLCVDGLKSKGLSENPVYRERLKKEIRAIDLQGEYDYFVNLYEKCNNEGLYFPTNENNLLIVYLLGISDDIEIEREPNFYYGEMPDADLDFIGDVRDYLKNVWAPKTFGEDFICNVGNFSTFGIKSSLLDAARVFSLDHSEIQFITKKIGLKDDEGDNMTFEAALEMYPDLKAYCDANPEAAMVAQRLVGRNRGTGKHAGGFIVSSKPLNEIIPLMKSADGSVVSAFTEGQHQTDLAPMGLVKIDLLVVSDLKRIAEAVKLVKERHGLKSVCALPGGVDWSDTSYINDPKCLELASQGKTKGIFQFESDGMRELLKKGGVDRFEDLEAYNALYRPSCMQMDMHNAYVHRKKGKEQYQIDSIIKPVVEKTYGIMPYQEQVMRILNIVGGIPLTHCEKIRKAISKKKLEIFGAYKDQFIENATKLVGEEKAKFLWDLVESFSGYGFNKSHSCCYSYTACRLLWLKTYYPIEFFAATLTCEGMGEKVKEYKLDAERFGMTVNRVDLNKSDWKFKIVNNEIYMGFSGIKGIGEDSAEQIVANQPYSSLEDFLTRCTTQSKVVKPLIALGLFPEANRQNLYEFYEYFKDQTAKRTNRFARNTKSREEVLSELYGHLIEGSPRNIEVWSGFQSIGDCAELIPYVDPLKGSIEDVWKKIKKYKKNVEGFQKKLEEDEPIRFKDFVPTGELDEATKELLTGPLQLAEREFYGFAWRHIIEESPDYKGGRSFDQFDDETIAMTAVEGQIVHPAEEKTSKSGKMKYYKIKLEDANGTVSDVTIWKADYDRFKEEFDYWDVKRGGLLVSIQLDRPQGGFKGYTLNSPPKQWRWKLLPASKEVDGRLLVYRWPENKENP